MGTRSRVDTSPVAQGCPRGLKLRVQYENHTPGLLRHSREMTLPCSRNLTQQPAFGGDDIAFPTFGLRTKARRVRWVTLSEQKWVIPAERRGLGERLAQTEPRLSRSGGSPRSSSQFEV